MPSKPSVTQVDGSRDKRRRARLRKIAVAVQRLDAVKNRPELRLKLKRLCDEIASLDRNILFPFKC